MAADHDFVSHLFTLDGPYPWDRDSSEAEVYLTSLDTAANDLLNHPTIDDTLSTGWATWSEQIEAQWHAGTTSSSTSLLARLNQQFQERVPASLLQTIATTASHLARSGRPLIEQLVDCVNDALPGWESDDLAVLARPLAYSLRDGRREILALNLRSISQADWNTLSDIEQARLSLAIASVALKAAEQEN
ncbi:MAG: hypothetical protein EA342_18145 [Leptolyngbya sp. LCM1.Bin17]|nr:MAG: hypothetical protein EA342_18145 [Leptolyngbya sp. LCM1.Bin17]